MPNLNKRKDNTSLLKVIAALLLLNVLMMAFHYMTKDDTNIKVDCKDALYVIEHADKSIDVYEVVYNNNEHWANVFPTDSIPFWAENSSTKSRHQIQEAR